MLFSNDKEYLHNCRLKIGEFINNELGLEYSKADVFDIKQGVDFCGYRHFRKYVLVRKSSSKRLIKRFDEEIEPQVKSGVFDKTIEYILGTSDDDKSPKLNDAQIEQLGVWAIEDDCRKVMKDYMSLDEFGKAAVENLIQLERLRCMNQQTIKVKMEDTRND